MPTGVWRKEQSNAATISIRVEANGMSKQSLSLSVSLLLGVVILQSLVSVYAKAPDRFAASEFNAQDQSNVEYRIKPKDLLNITIEGVCISSLSL